jgi:hypothetical protein
METGWEGASCGSLLVWPTQGGLGAFSCRVNRNVYIEDLSISSLGVERRSDDDHRCRYGSSMRNAAAP